jgi:propanol-preferring alcohol dehydrogenase
VVYNVNGSFAIGAVGYPSRLLKRADFVGADPCAGIATKKALKATEAQPGEWVAISVSVGLAMAVRDVPACGRLM